jgi:hypothetical protein
MFFQKAARVAGAAATANIAGRPCSLWTYDGVNWPGGTAPGAVAAPTSATTGAIVPYTNPSGGRQKHLIQAWATGLVGGTLIIYDRLLHISGLDGTNVGAQTVAGSLTRNTGGAGNFAFAEIYTIIGTTARTITMSYTNTTPTGGRTSPAVAIGATGFREVTRAIMLPLQSGDTGITSVESVTLSATTGTAGDFGITVGKPITYVGIGAAGACGWRDFTVGLPGIPQIEDDACLAALWIPNTVTAPEIWGGLSFVEA